MREKLAKNLRKALDYLLSRSLPWFLYVLSFTVATLCSILFLAQKVSLTVGGWAEQLSSLEVTVLFWILTCISGLYNQQAELLLQARDAIQQFQLSHENANTGWHNANTTLLDSMVQTKTQTEKALTNILTTMDLHVRSGSVFTHPPLIRGKSALINEVSLKAHDNSKYLSIHSEVLYYSMLCSLLECWRDQVEEIHWAHAFFPNSPAEQFLPEILNLVSEDLNLKSKCKTRIYLFRNDVLDYDRRAMSNAAVTQDIEEHGRPRQQHLWGAFAKASHILFRDGGALYGFLKPTGSKSIWGEDNRLHRYHEKFERLQIKFKDDSIVCVVTRDLDTFEFRQAEIVSGDEGRELIKETEQYFREMASKKDDGLYPASEWESYKVEVALVSGEVMESHAGSGVTLWAVDDFPVDEHDGTAAPLQGWEVPGSTRDIAWSKSVVAALKGAKINRVFLIEKELFENPANSVLLFEIMASQYLFLTPGEKFSPLPQYSDCGGVKLTFKSKANSSEGVADQSGNPDLALMTKRIDDKDVILGGVIVLPVATYITPSHPDGPNWQKVASDLWNEGQHFPACFAPVKDKLESQIDHIAERIAEREELDLTRHKTLDKLKSELREWLRQVIAEL